MPSFRYERKARIQDADEATLLHVIQLHPALFRRAYPSRWVNNVYLDTLDLWSYRANVEGLAEREKVRVRWYGPQQGPIEAARLEFKIKSGHVGTKETYPLSGFKLELPFDASLIHQLLERAALPAPRRERLQGFEPRLLNRYRRHYFVSLCGRFRVTLDVEQWFHSLRRFDNRLSQAARDRALIVELKYDREWDGVADPITGRFPFAFDKSSKYVQGLHTLDS